MSERRLAEVGVHSADDLERIGALEAYRLVKAAFPRETTLVWYYALKGALLDVLWKELPRDLIAAMKAEAEGI